MNFTDSVPKSLLSDVMHKICCAGCTLKRQINGGPNRQGAEKTPKFNKRGRVKINGGVGI